MEVGKYAPCLKKLTLFGVTKIKYRDWQKVNMEKLKELDHDGHQLPR